MQTNNKNKGNSPKDSTAPKIEESQQLSSLSLIVDWCLEIEDERIQRLFVASQRVMVLRIAWTCLIYNVMICVTLVFDVGLDFFSVGNLCILCVSNSAAIVTVIVAYKDSRWLHAVGPLIMLT